MTDREKLEELLYRAHHNASCVMGYSGSEEKAIEEEARYLLANGVTVREWIPVTEKLPDVEKETNAIRITQTVQATDGKEHFFGYFTIYKYDESWQFVCADEAINLCAIDTVTHWMPLLEPPKEE